MTPKVNLFVTKSEKPYLRIVYYILKSKSECLHERESLQMSEGNEQIPEHVNSLLNSDGFAIRQLSTLRSFGICGAPA